MGGGIAITDLENVKALAQAPDGGVVVGGSFNSVGSGTNRVIASNSALWDGTLWHALSGFSSWSTNTLATSGSQIYRGTSISSPYALGFDLDVGNTFELGPGVDKSVYALAQAPGGLLYVGGYFIKAGSLNVSHIATWGEASPQPTPSATSSPTRTATASSQATSSCSRTPSRPPTPSTSPSLAAAPCGFGAVGPLTPCRWDGLAGGVGTRGFDGPNVLSVISDGQSGAYIGGAFDAVGGLEAHGVARFDGTRWTSLSTGVGTTGTVRALLLGPLNELYVGGVFTSAGSVSASNVAMWSAGQWSALGAGVQGPITAFAMSSRGVLFCASAAPPAFDTFPVWVSQDLVALRAALRTSLARTQLVGAVTTTHYAFRAPMSHH